jgi:hypothetical protein
MVRRQRVVLQQAGQREAMLAQLLQGTAMQQGDLQLEWEQHRHYRSPYIQMVYRYQA